MLRKVIVLLVTLMVACRSETTVTLNEHLPGKYELFIGSNQSYSRRDFVTSTLLLKQDGTFEQSCGYQNASLDSRSIGKWEVNSNYKGIQFEGLLDCAGVWSQNWTGNANLILEGSSKPQILLDPDRNIFYKKIDE